VREVFPHTALRQPSTGGIQGFKPLNPLRLATSSQAQRLSAFWHSGLVCAEVLVICLGVWLAHWGHAPSLTFPLDPIEVEALPSWRVVLSRPSAVLWPPPTSHPASLRISLSQLIPQVTVAVADRPSKTSPVPSSPVLTSPSPYAGGFFTVALSGSSPFPWPSLSLTSSAPSFSLSG
jgi:hypothetical protein